MISSSTKRKGHIPGDRPDGRAEVWAALQVAYPCCPIGSGGSQWPETRPDTLAGEIKWKELMVRGTCAETTGIPVSVSSIVSARIWKGSPGADWRMAGCAAATSRPQSCRSRVAVCRRIGIGSGTVCGWWCGSSAKERGRGWQGKPADRSARIREGKECACM